MSSSAQTGRRRRFQQGSLLAIPGAVAIVVGSQLLEGGSWSSLLQSTAALIVVGGTLAATLISYAPGAVFDAVKEAARSFGRRDDDLAGLSSQLVAMAVRAHRNGVLSLEAELDQVDDEFLRNGLALAVDGVEPALLRDLLTTELRARETIDDEPARIFESAAGYAPTFGILGAVLGLIHVMRSLATPGALGEGVAVAFVATVYGLGLANLLLLPLASRLRERALAITRRRELILEAVVGLRGRMHPRLLAQTMRGMTPAAAQGVDAPARPASPLHVVVSAS
jgi:chemotaxis protein MotA